MLLSFYLTGRSQVLIGVVPKDTPYLSNQSCKSVYPLAIANCKEDRYDNDCDYSHKEYVNS